jgi:hypothetical protein
MEVDGPRLQREAVSGGPGLAPACPMALVKCKECGVDISDSVKACPKCGKKRGMGFLGKLFVYGFGGFFALVVIVSAASGGKGSSGGGSSPRGGSSAPSAPEEPPVEVSAPTIHKAYHANEVAADAQYKGKRVLLTGTIEGIKKDAFDSPYLSIDSGQMFMTVHCSFAKDSLGQLAQLSKGNSVKVSGKVQGMVVGSVMVRDCRLQ